MIQSPTIQHLVGTLAGTALILAVSACTAASSATSSLGASEPVRSVAASVSEAPSAEFVTGPLGRGLILVHDAYDASNPGLVLDVFTLDAGTGQQTLLGTVPSGGGSYGNTYNFQWSADRKHVLITQNGQGLVPLDNLTAAGRDLIVVCCAPAREALPNGEGTQPVGAYDWALSPQGDRIAGLRNGLIDTPGCLLCSAPDSIVILDVDSGELRTLPLPPGSLGSLSRYPISWSPDESAVVMGGCRPCNDPYSPGIADITPTAVEHGHLFIVPVDGSPVREFLDATETGLYSAAWSPDGTTIAFGRYECAADEHAPYCQRGTHRLERMNVATGEDTIVAEVTGDHFFWSPDGRWITFADQSVMVVDADGGHLTKVADGWEPTWSPDGKWLMFSTTSGAPSFTRLGPWIVPADGGQPRLLGPFEGWGW